MPKELDAVFGGCKELPGEQAPPQQNALTPISWRSTKQQRGWLMPQQNALNRPSWWSCWRQQETALFAAAAGELRQLTALHLLQNRQLKQNQLSSLPESFGQLTALRLLQDLQLQGLLPDVITYNAAKSACEKGKQPQQPQHPLRELQLRALLPTIKT